MREKRQSERFRLEIPIAIECLISDRERRLLNLLTRNICSGGAYFHTTQALSEGTKVKIDLVLPLDRLKTLNDEYRQAYIKVAGTVLRSESEGMAVCFDEDYQITRTANGRLER
jgi:hypothetical protein